MVVWAQHSNGAKWTYLTVLSQKVVFFTLTAYPGWNGWDRKVHCVLGTSDNEENDGAGLALSCSFGEPTGTWMSDAGRKKGDWEATSCMPQNTMIVRKKFNIDYFGRSIRVLGISYFIMRKVLRKRNLAHVVHGQKVAPRPITSAYVIMPRIRRCPVASLSLSFSPNSRHFMVTSNTTVVGAPTTLSSQSWRVFTSDSCPSGTE
jgi:hypothetical protein